ncbi:MAG TPA: hypothetical protein PKV88_01115 [Bacteroidales bacterium]|nr:hypothetical protein [Bacteroidales bacterium]MDD4086251.1 hypothetical protein [Bacteroidales bacterium]MDY0085294.1 hypothetical protein [Bacteroidales bacterium]HPE42652.1 hypothetical protein [Bacteroidales bacterium]
MRPYRLLLFSWIVWMIVFGVSCNSPASYKSETSFENQIWNRFDVQEYTFMPEENATKWDVFFIFEHLENYYTDHIDVNITFYLPNGATRSRDYAFRLKNDKLEWTGKQDQKLVTHELSVIKGFSFDQSGPLNIRVESKMTKFNLGAVQKIGIILKESKNQP